MNPRYECQLSTGEEASMAVDDGEMIGDEAQR